MKEIFPGIYRIGRNIVTKNLAPGISVYNEKRIKIKGVEYRVWDPYKSKLAAAILKRLKNTVIKPRNSVLYLGIAQGTTASHVSDIIGGKGIIFGVEIAPKPFEKLLEICKKRKNIIPIMADANKPEEYSKYVEKVDVVYEDVAQKNQVEILLKNVKKYLKKKGFAVIAIKARSIDVAAKPSEIFRKEIEKLKKEMKVLEVVRLEPFEKDHVLVVLANKS